MAGPPASGKTTRILERLRAELRAGNFQSRLLVPSATMAEHLRNQLAREGVVLRRDTVSTFSHFIESLAGPSAAASPALFEQILRKLLRRNCPPEFVAVQDTPGFVRHLAATFDSLSLANVDPARLDNAIGQLYFRSLQALDKQGLTLRGHRLHEAAANLPGAKLPHVYLDGFFDFAKAELSFLDALSQHTQVTVSVSTPGNGPGYRQPAIETIEAPDRAQEVLLIAGRILALATQGVELRRIGVLLRAPGVYEPILESTFARLGIPSRSYTGMQLSRHPVTAFCRDVLAAVESGWEYGATLNAVRWIFTGLGGTDRGDQLERRVIEAMPAHGLDPFPQLLAFENWPILKLHPLEAAQEIRKLRLLFAPPQSLPEDAEIAWRWQQKSTALDSLFSEIDKVAASLDDPLTLPQLWQLAESSFLDCTLRERDARRNVVHVMDLFEGRQWELDHIFAPGLLEGEFPKRFSPDPLLNESLKRTFGMKTVEDRHKEEHQLFDLLLTRAHKYILLSYPRANDKGDPTSPSLFLAGRARPAPFHRLTTRSQADALSTGQLTSSYRDPRPWSASEFETYIACPWKHFAAYGLRLQGLPSLPAERLDVLFLGTLAHDIIRLWTLNPQQDIQSLADRELTRACRDQRIPGGYHLERERINLLRNLRLYAQNAPPVPAGWQVYTEERFTKTLASGIEVRGQIDRYDLSPSGEVHAYDYKYSKADNASEKNPIQSALYAIVLGQGSPPRAVSRFTFVGLRDAARLVPLEGQVLADAIAIANAEMTRVRDAVRAGLIPVEPANPDNCQYCDFHDACRIRAVEVTEVPEEAVEWA